MRDAIQRVKTERRLTFVFVVIFLIVFTLIQLIGVEKHEAKIETKANVETIK